MDVYGEWVTIAPGEERGNFWDNSSEIIEQLSSKYIPLIEIYQSFSKKKQICPL